ncbi:hypothetical protein Bhyg_11499 [Pseudolycoriella hygida]|uniref:Uncharacterized protein n=1 Tax=Pseudolycoriella hygida TaxID=35572 RepID=A0A9Q0S003_9DIPT|nr:hypothetical protein Bhyg_11499 [Pseudolycoriella hygida]
MRSLGLCGTSFFPGNALQATEIDFDDHNSRNKSIVFLRDSDLKFAKSLKEINLVSWGLNSALICYSSAYSSTVCNTQVSQNKDISKDPYVLVSIFRFNNILLDFCSSSYVINSNQNSIINATVP